jgi:hypothetical protein
MPAAWTYYIRVNDGPERKIFRGKQLVAPARYEAPNKTHRKEDILAEEKLFEYS